MASIIFAIYATRVVTCLSYDLWRVTVKLYGTPTGAMRTPVHMVQNKDFREASLFVCLRTLVTNSIAGKLPRS